MANTSLDELKLRATNNFSEKEVEDFVNMGKILASKAVLSALTAVINDGVTMNLSATTAERLSGRVKSLMPYEYSGYADVELAGMDIRLRIQLALCNRNYKAEVQVPDDEGFIKDLYTQYDFLKKMAIAYWKSFMEDNADLVTEIMEYRADVDFTMMTIDSSSPTTLYFDPNCEKRVGLLPYYVNKQGVPMRPKK